jgi:hypothetical protein
MPPPLAFGLQLMLNPSRKIYCMLGPGSALLLHLYAYSTVPIIRSLFMSPAYFFLLNMPRFFSFKTKDAIYHSLFHFAEWGVAGKKYSNVVSVRRCCRP